MARRNASPQARKAYGYRRKEMRRRTAVELAWRDVMERATAERLAEMKQRRRWTG